MQRTFTRRTVLKGSAAVTAASILLPRSGRAAEPINVGSLTPNTGGGGPYGPNMAAAIRRVADEVNANGGLLGGRQIQLTQEDSETNPETAVRAADKLINVNQSLAILGTWASSVTLGIMPKCQDANVIQMFTSSSSDIPARDEKGLGFNFQILNPLWGAALGQLALERGFENYSMMALNNDFTKSLLEGFSETVGEERLMGEPFYYNANQSSYRSEVTRLVEGNPEAVFIAGYVTDFTAVYKEIFRAGYEGQVIVPSICVGGPFKDAIGDAANGILHGIPIPPLESPAYAQYLEEAGLEKTDEVQHPYGTACRDEMSVLALAIEKAGDTDPLRVAEAVWDVSTGEGKKTVYNVIEGLEALRAGEEINYSGAGSAVEFDDEGQLRNRDVRLYEIKDGQDAVITTLQN